MLSGGQRQRTALARALALRPSILILDDTLSSVDAATEVAIQRGLAEVFAGRTVVVVASRVSTVRDCDQIIVLDEGAVVEQGPTTSCSRGRPLRAAGQRAGRLGAPHAEWRRSWPPRRLSRVAAEPRRARAGRRGLSDVIHEEEALGKVYDSPADRAALAVRLALPLAGRGHAADGGAALPGSSWRRPGSSRPGSTGCSCRSGRRPARRWPGLKWILDSPLGISPLVWLAGLYLAVACSTPA